MHDLNPTRQGLHLIMGALGCLAANVLLYFVHIQYVGYLKFLVQFAGYGLFLVGIAMAMRQASGTSRLLLAAAAVLLLIGMAISALGIVLSMTGLALGPNQPEFFGWYGLHSSPVQLGLQLIAFAFFYYFLLSLDYSESDFRQGMIGWVAPGRGFAFGMIFAILGVLQLVMGALATDHAGLWLGNAMVAGSALLLMLATINRVPPPIAAMPGDPNRPGPM